MTQLPNFLKPGTDMVYYRLRKLGDDENSDSFSRGAARWAQDLQAAFADYERAETEAQRHRAIRDAIGAVAGVAGLLSMKVIPPAAGAGTVAAGGSAAGLSRAAVPVPFAAIICPLAPELCGFDSYGLPDGT